MKYLICALLLTASCVRPTTPSEPGDSVSEEERWSELKDGLYVDEGGALAFRIEGLNRNGEPKVYFQTHFGESPLKEQVDVESFRRVEDSLFYRDDARIYHLHEQAGGGKLMPREDLDPESFRLLPGCYAADRAHVYTERGRALQGADRATFFSSDAVSCCMGADADGFFRWADRIDAPDTLAKEELACLAELKKQRDAGR